MKSKRNIIVTLVMVVVVLANINFALPTGARKRATASIGAKLSYFPAAKPLDQHSTFYLSNQSENAKDVTLLAYDKSGINLGALSRHLGAGGTVSITSSELPASTASLTFSSDFISGLQVIESADGGKAEAIKAIEATSNQLDFPQLLDGDSGSKTLFILNPSPVLATATLVLFDAQGAEIRHINLGRLGANESRAVGLGSLLRGSGLTRTGLVRISSDTNLVGFQLIDPPEGDIVALPALVSYGNQWEIPLASAVNAFGVLTEARLFNPSDRFVMADVETVNETNQSVGSPARLLVAPRGVTTVSAPSTSSQLIRIRTNSPVAAYELLTVTGSAGAAALISPTALNDQKLFLSASFDGSSLIALLSNKAANPVSEINALEPAKELGMTETAESQLTQEEAVITSQAVSSATLGFRPPVDQVSVNASCNIGGVCAGSSTNLHTAVDYSLPSVGAAAFASNFGTLKRSINYDQNVGCASLSCNMGNSLVMEYLLTSGDKLLSVDSHLESKSVSVIGSRIAKGQKLGPIGCSGSTICGWCSTPSSCSGNKHVHHEFRVAGLPHADQYSDLWPFGYMNQAEANELRNSGEATITIQTALSRAFKSVSDLQSQQVLIPYLSFSNSAPTSSNYDVYGIANQSLYASITVTPASAKTFTNLGVGGRVYGDDTQNRDVFNITSSSFAGNQAKTLSGSRSNLSTGDYKFFAYVDTSSQGYPLKVSILPNSNSRIVDNDSRSGYVEDAQGATDTAGYYLSGKLYKGGNTTNYAEWRPSLTTGSYEVWVHVPDKATAQSVAYRIYVDGISFITTAPVSHSGNQDKWVQLTSGSTREFNLNPSAFVRLDNSAIRTAGTDQFVGADAVKFVYIGSGSPTCSDTGEPNDSFGQAYSISCDATTAAKICSASDIDYYRFTPSMSGNATMTLTPPVDKDYDLYVYNSGQAEVGRSTAGTGAIDRITASVVSGQTYYIKVVGYSGAFSSASSYGLGISCPTASATPAVSSFAINNGAASTNSTTVTLNNLATNSPTQYQASESSSFSGASWLAYSISPSFTLTTTTGTKTVYFRVRNAAGTVSASVSDTIVLNAPGVDNSAFVSDVTVPDNSQMNPGQGFVKTWRLKNTGTTNWGTGYSLVFVSGSQMNAPSAVAVPATAPGGTADLSVSMIAPSGAGTYQGNWRLRNPAGQLFGVEVWVKIVVVVATPISWDFNTTGNFQGWSCINIQAASVNNGALFVDFAGADPYITGPNISAGASVYKYLQLRMASNALDSAGKIYFRTTAENFYSEDKTVSFFVSNCSLCGNAAFVSYSIYLGGNSKWSGTVTGIRVDPANNASSVRTTDTVGFDYIRLSQVP
jgi:hypothetical protein